MFNMTFIDLQTIQLYSLSIIYHHFFFGEVEALYTIYGNRIFIMVALFHLEGVSKYCNDDI